MFYINTISKCVSELYNDCFFRMNQTKIITINILFLLLINYLTILNKILRMLLLFGCIGYLTTNLLVPKLKSNFLKIGLQGRDLSKPKQQNLVPEAIGIIPASIYLIIMICFIPFLFYKHLYTVSAEYSKISEKHIDYFQYDKKNQIFPYNELAKYLSAVICLQGTVMLGIYDDLFDIKWRNKFFLPAIAGLPILIVYYINFSSTTILIPKFVFCIPGSNIFLIFIKKIIYYFGVLPKMMNLRINVLSASIIDLENGSKLIDLGFFYYIYMSLISIFLPNSINILAGINGLELGQSLILGLIFFLDNLYHIFIKNTTEKLHESHLFSMIFIVPFMGVSLGLLKYNWYPSSVFIGDTYCYFAGMVFVIICILGHFSKSILLFLIPQLINFVYSAPQILGLLPCPRHRIPSYISSTGLLSPSYAPFVSKYRLINSIFNLLEKIHLISLKRNSKNEIVEFSNMTILNLFLICLGPMHEKKLCKMILIFQFSICLLAVIIKNTFDFYLCSSCD